MARSLHADVITELSAARYRAAYMVDLGFDAPTGTQRFWTGVGSLTYSGNTYTGTGNLGNVSIVEEAAEVRPAGVRLSLSGVAASLLSIALGEQYQGRAATVYLAFFNEQWVMVGTPVTIYAGKIDVFGFVDSGAECELWITVENRLADFERPGEVYFFTDLDQQRKYAGDRGFEFTAVLVDKTFFWGRVQPGNQDSDSVAPPPPPSSGGGGGDVGGDPGEGGGFDGPADDSFAGHDDPNLWNPPDDSNSGNDYGNYPPGTYDGGGSADYPDEY